MKRLHLISLGVLIAVVLCACTAKNPVSSGNPKTDNKIDSQEKQTASEQQSKVQQEKVDIVIEPPSGWEKVTGSVLQCQYLKNTISFMVKEEKFEGKNLDDVITEAKKIYEKAFKDVSYENDTEAITVDGKDAMKMLFTCKVSGMNMKYEYVYLFAGEAVYVITFGGPVNDFDSLAEDYEKILADIRFQ